MSRSLFQQLDASSSFPEQPLFEDVELSKRLSRLVPSRFRAPSICVGASARRWQTHGVVRTVLSMWGYRLRYAFGASAEQLSAQYYLDTPQSRMAGSHGPVES